MRSQLRARVLTMLLTLGLIVGGGVALAAVGSVTTHRTEAACAPDQICDKEEPGEVADDQAQEGEDQGGDSQDDASTRDEQAPPEDDSEPGRAAECSTAAGRDRADSALDESDVATGLDHAIEQVLANCLMNPGAPGLPNALEHLVANSERRAAHAAAKAAGAHGKADERGPRAEHGHAGGHGRGAEHGHSDDAHGDAGHGDDDSIGEPGHSGEHGNSHE